MSLVLMLWEYFINISVPLSLYFGIVAYMDGKVLISKQNKIIKSINKLNHEVRIPDKLYSLDDRELYIKKIQDSHEIHKSGISVPKEMIKQPKSSKKLGFGIFKSIMKK